MLYYNIPQAKMQELCISFYSAFLAFKRLNGRKTQAYYKTQPQEYSQKIFVFLGHIPFICAKQ
jgi:hypothetical protein